MKNTNILSLTDYEVEIIKLSLESNTTPLIKFSGLSEGEFSIYTNKIISDTKNLLAKINSQTSKTNPVKDEEKEVLHTHPGREKQLGLDEHHCIVNRKDVENITNIFKFFNKNQC